MASLYLHIPFCEHKCIYCDFYSIESLDLMERFVKALKCEIGLYADYGGMEKIETVFFGGGTPSLLKPEVLEDLIGLLHRTYRIEPDAEITLEANPGTVDADKLRSFRRAGINRLSFGVQSFHDDELKFLTRIHSGAQAREAVRMAREAGFDNINIDLIFALPGQSMERWEANLRAATSLGTTHVSAYSLIVERGTPLARMVDARLVAPLPVESEAAQYEFTMGFLLEEGFEHYEVSNYAKPGFRSRHNSNYWNHSNYLGFGPSAHSFWSNRRWWNIRSVDAYVDRIAAGRLPIAGQEELSAGQLIDEAIMLGLRSDGIDLNRLRNDFGLDLLELHASTIAQLVTDGLTVLDNANRLRLTARGFLVCDEISERLMAAEVAAGVNR